MKLIPNDLDAFLHFDEVVSISDAIRSKTQEIVHSLESDIDRSKAIFEWVRDNIHHTKDLGAEVVTCSSIDTFSEGTGICFAKSHLVASMMRSEGIPCGFCYQVFDNPVATDSDSLALHGLNAIYLESTSRWHRLDPRGNRVDVNAEFSVDREILAFPDMLFMDDCIYAAPLKKVVQGLQTASNITGLWTDLPAINMQNKTELGNPLSSRSQDL